MKAKIILKKIRKIFAWIVGILVFLIVLAYILIQLPAVQNYARKKIVAYIHGKIKTKVEIGKLTLDFPKRLVLEHVYFEDQEKDTLFYGGKIRVDISLFKLLSDEVDIQYLGLDSIRTNIYRLKPGTAFNFDYVVNAFSGGPQTPPGTGTDTSSNFTFNIGKIALDNIVASFKDDGTGNDIDFKLGHLETTFKRFDPYKLAFDIPSIDISNVITTVHQYPPLLYNAAVAVKPPDSTSSPNPSIDIGAVTLEQINCKYQNDISNFSALLQVGDFVTHPGKINLQNPAVVLNDVMLNNTIAKVTFEKAGTSGVVAQVSSNQSDSSTNNSWKFEITKANFNNDEIVYNDNNTVAAKYGFDYNHIHITHLTIDADSLLFTPSIYEGSIRQLAFDEKSGLQVQQLHSDFYYSDTAAYLTNLLLRTNSSVIQNRVIAKYPSVESLTQNLGNLYVDANLDHSVLGVKDILEFLPDYEKNLRAYENESIQLNAQAKGYLKDISIPELEASGLGNTHINISGRMRGLPDVKSVYCDVAIKQFTSTKKDILSFIPSNTLPENVYLPGNIALNGNFKGSVNDFATKLVLKTDKGNAELKGTMKPGNTYTVQAMLQNVNAGYLTKQPQKVGLISGTLNAQGSGFDLKKANAAYDINISSANIKGYTYTGLKINGNVKNGIDTTTASIHNAALSFNMNAHADLRSAYPPLRLDLLIDTLNARKLNLMNDTLTISGHLVADLPSTNPDDLKGKINITSLSVTTAGKKLNTDSISLVASGDSLNKTIVLNADGLNTSLSGKYKLTEIAPAVEQVINQYYNIPGYTPTNITEQNWQFHSSIQPRGVLLQIAPQMKGSDSIVMDAHLNSSQNDFGLTAKTLRLITGDNQVDSLNIITQTTPESLAFSASVVDARSGSLKLFKTAIHGKVANNQVDVDAIAKDDKGKKQYALGALLQQAGAGFNISLKPELTLDYDPWDVAKDNSIYYDSSDIIVNNFEISRKDQSIAINSASQSATAPVNIGLKHFEISTIARLAHEDSLLASGLIDGTAQITNPTKNLVFTSDLSVSDLTYKLDTIGNLNIKVNNKIANAYNADVTLTGNNNNVHLSGIYYTGESSMNLNLDMKSLNLAMIKPFAAGQLNDITGMLTGSVAIAGTTSGPRVNGDLHFKNASFIPTISGERFNLPTDAIAVDPQGIHFTEFTMIDSAGNKAIVDGSVLTTDFKKFAYNLTLKAHRFTLVNSIQTTDKIFYGKLIISTDATIQGEMAQPQVNANLRVIKGTDFTVILPQTDPEVQDRQGVVRFVDENNPLDTVSTQRVTDSLSTSEMTGIDVNANISTDSTAKFTMIIDQRSGDALTLQGIAHLNGGIDKSGKITLTGAYQLESGSYNLSLSILKRQFLIQQGSTITWTGDPMNANIDVTAVYVANTAPIDLMQSSLAGRSPQDVTRYKEKLPFQVSLHMTGALLKPVISFGIALPDRQAAQWPDVTSQLQQESQDPNELNKQVFALLLLGRFVQENPFVSSGGGGGLEDQVRSSASSILTDQLNRLAASLIKGVDVNFNLTSGTDYTSGQASEQTNLNVGVSKRLLNDRLRVSVGSNFELEGPSNTNQNTSNIAGDVSVDYQLTKDGRYILRVYRLNEYEGVLEGQVVETGLSFILTFDYNKFSELFTGRKRSKRFAPQNKNVSKESMHQPGAVVEKNTAGKSLPQK